MKNISLLQWHPFSVSSSPLDGKYHLEVLIKTVGEWTTKLRETVSKNSAEDSDIQLPHAPYQIMASVEGPYGHESPYYLRFVSYTTYSTSMHLNENHGSKTTEICWFLL